MIDSSSSWHRSCKYRNARKHDDDDDDDTAVQRTHPVTYFLRDSAGEPISGGCYEHELHSVANPDVYLIEKIIRRKGNRMG